MRIDELIHDLPVRLRAGAGETEIAHLAEDSRRTEAGDLFIARRGSESDGRRFIPDAISRGAAAVLIDQPDELPPIPSHIPLLLAESLSPSLIARLAQRLFGHPQRKMELIGVTGTNGKTTVAFMIRHLLAEAGVRGGLIGTIETDDGLDRQPAPLTTPGVVEMHRLLARMAEHGCACCVMEVSSHALAQGRVAELPFHAAVFTNLTGDHLDYHHTMEAYAEAKAILFDSLSPDACAIVNAGDPATERMIRRTGARILPYTTEGGSGRSPGDTGGLSPTARADILAATAERTDCRFTGPWGDIHAHLPLIGRHNVGNMLAALTTVHTLGVEAQSFSDTLNRCPPIPGRLERIRIGDEDPPCTVLVDYAHTDDALGNVLSALRPLTRGRLRVVFGCGGDRDHTKRPRMARIAAEHADNLIITSDNPRTEDPHAIIGQILAGVPADSRHQTRILPDRAEAIREAIEDARSGDVVLIAGKGHEDYQIIGDERLPFDDREHARRGLGVGKEARAVAESDGSWGK